MTDPISDLYDAFARKDGPAMAACYAEDATFSDPVFPALSGAEVGMMWRMLCERGKDLVIDVTSMTATDGGGEVQWEARYTFSGTGRKVHNIVTAQIEVRDGKIVKHTDTFDLWRWTRQALGPAGVVLGWSPMVRNKVRGQAKKALDGYIAKAA